MKLSQVPSLLAVVATLFALGGPKSAAAQSFPPPEKWLRDNEDKDDSATIGLRCPSREQCLRPGICTRSRLDTEQSKKDGLCGRPRSCGGIIVRAPMDANNIRASERVDCNLINQFIEAGRSCRDQRTEVMKCFRGGDQTHADERATVQQVLAECEDKLRSAKSLNLCQN